MTSQDDIAKTYQYKHGDRPLDGYTIQRAAGRGGFGEVYYAISDSQKEVALKVVNTYEQIELRGTAQCINLKSPHLVTIFDVKYGQDQRPWIIMEFVNGPSLQELLKAAPAGLEPAKAAFFIREIAKGLSYLHQCGVVHRDLKPGNIFYENGYVKIGDYGLSKSISTTAFSGQTIAVGTLHYMAPEIGDGRYGPGIDIYALGAILYEMLTGRVPFAGSSWGEVIIKHARGEINLDGINEPFASVIAKAMAKDPKDRYQTATEMAEALCGPQPVQETVSQFAAPMPRADSKMAPIPKPEWPTKFEPRPLLDPATRENRAWIKFAAIVAGTVASLVIVAVFFGFQSPSPMVAAQMSATPTPGGDPLQVLNVNAASGDSTAMLQLGDHYKNGILVPQNFQIAMFWYQKATAAGNDLAMCSIGQLYDLGLGVPKNETLAATWYRKAAEAHGPNQNAAIQWLSDHHEALP